jgi:hypothetical protein
LTILLLLVAVRVVVRTLLLEQVAVAVLAD